MVGHSSCTSSWSLMEWWFLWHRRPCSGGITHASVTSGTTQFHVAATVPRLCPRCLGRGPCGVRNPVPSWHTYLLAWDPQNPWVNLLSAGCLRLSPTLPIKLVHCSSEVCFPGSAVDTIWVVEHGVQDSSELCLTPLQGSPTQRDVREVGEARRSPGSQLPMPRRE